MMSLPNTMDTLNHFKPDIHINSTKKIRLCERALCTSYKDRLMLFRKTITVYSETH